MKHSLPLRALSRFLQYPDAELIQHSAEVTEALLEMPKLTTEGQGDLIVRLIISSLLNAGMTALKTRFGAAT